MINAFAGLLAGFNGAFEFESGVTYPPELKYTVMRVINAIFGALVTPLAYTTAIHMKMSQSGAILFALMTVFDNALCTISRFILLDSMLLFFTALAICAVAVFHSDHQKSPMSLDWHISLFVTGLSLGLVLSVKWYRLIYQGIFGEANLR